MMKKNILFRFFVFGAVLTSCGASLEKSKSQIEFSSMNTQMTVTAYGKNSEQAVQAAKDEIINLESLLSVTREDSDVYKINNAAGQTISVNDKTISVISLALKIAEETEEIRVVTEGIHYLCDFAFRLWNVFFALQCFYHRKGDNISSVSDRDNSDVGFFRTCCCNIKPVKQSEPDNRKRKPRPKSS